MIQGHMQVESMKENRHNEKENININQKRKRMMPKEDEETVHGQIGAVALISA